MRTTKCKAEAELVNGTEHSHFLCFVQVILRETLVEEELGDNSSEIV